MEPPKISHTVIKRAKGKSFSLTIRSVTEQVQPLVEKCFPSYIVQLRYFRSCMENMRYFEKHDKAAVDHKETAFKIDRYPSQISGHTLRLSHNVLPSLFPLDSYKFS